VFVEMVRRKKAKLADNRLSSERVARCLSDSNPYKERVLDIVKGVEMCTADDYTDCKYEERPALEKLFMETAAAVEKMCFDSFWEEGLSIILTEHSVKAIEDLGLCIASWAKKHGKECGRPITNGSDRRRMNSAHIPNSKL
jgi:hypothetical protein